MSPEQVVELVERIAGDDFCEEAGCIFALGKVDNLPLERLRKICETAIRKLSDIYIITHSHVPSHSCYSAHDSWRSMAESWRVASVDE